MIKEILKKLGMTSNEVEIYLTVLNSNELSVNEIGSKSGLHRQVCYDALDRLVEKGFVSFVNKTNKKFYNALPPEKILDYLEEKKDEIKDILPKLNQMFIQDKSETNVQVIKGKKVVKTIMRDIFKELLGTKEKLYAMGVDEEKYLEFDPIEIKLHINRFKKHKLKEQLLAMKGAKTFFKGKQSEYRLIPQEMFNPNPTHIYKDKIAIIIWGNPVHGIIIKNSEIADANRKYFKMLWKGAKKR